MARKFRIKRPSPALVISLIALFVALSGSAVATTMSVIHAHTADIATKAKVATLAKNSLKLNKQTAAQVAATPGPATDLNGQTAAQIIAAASAAASGAAHPQVTIRSAGWDIAGPGVVNADWYANCNAGETAVGGGFDETSGQIVPSYDRPKTDGSGWWFKAKAITDASLPAGGSVWVVCLKTS
jgi:hypothetical protein